MYGGVIYGRVLDGVIPNWWEHAPIQRWVTRRATMVLTDTQALTVDFRTETLGPAALQRRHRVPPRLRPVARRAGHRGAGAARHVDDGDRAAPRGGRGRRRDAPTVPTATCAARVVIACDGVNSFLAKEAGLFDHFEPSHYTVGVKETLALPRDVIEERFGVRGLDGVDFEIVGCTQGVPGGGFLYTNLDTLSVGVVLQVTALAAQEHRPEEIIARMKQHPAIAPLVEGAELKEYTAHVIPEGGFHLMPELVVRRHAGRRRRGGAVPRRRASGSRA